VSTPYSRRPVSTYLTVLPGPTSDLRLERKFNVVVEGAVPSASTPCSAEGDPAGLPPGGLGGAADEAEEWLRRQ
jgi:hypothetical protein